MSTDFEASVYSLVYERYSEYFAEHCVKNFFNFIKGLAF